MPTFTEQLYTNCLAQGTYFIVSGTEAAIIDPLREIAPYLEKLKAGNLTLKYIFETHFHADFVSGHIDLAAATGATIVYGPTDMSLGFKAHIGQNYETFKIGTATVTLLHTPGHTLESACFLLSEPDGKPSILFTGDTIFLGDVGRPDLAQHVVAELTQEKLAGLLYDSIHNTILPLPDHLIVYPGHGAGSACGKNISNLTSDTLGHQKQTNYALDKNLSKNDFIAAVLSGLTPPPGYFPKNVRMNIQGYMPITQVIEKGTRPIPIAEFEYQINHFNLLVLDTRPPEEFIKGHIPNALNIGLSGAFAVWAGTLIPDIQQRIMLVCEPGTEKEAVTRLARVGYDYTVGYLEGGFEAWRNAQKPIATLPSIAPQTLFNVLQQQPNTVVLDVRKQSEYDSQHLLIAQNYPLDYINTQLKQLNPNDFYYIHCAGGYRSVIYASILLRKGFKHVCNIAGGFQALKLQPQAQLSQLEEQATAG